LSGDDLAVLDALDARGVGLRVAFCRRGQRVAHRIALVAGAAVQWLLASVEGDSHEAFPPSPPLQQLAVEPLGNGRTAALLIGMAGRSHWSVSAESARSEPVVRFDVACRARVVDPACLHSTYQVLCPWQLAPGGKAVDLRGQTGSVQLTASADADCPTTLAVHAQRLVVGLDQLGDRPTHRWRYTLMLDPHPDAPIARP